MKILLLILTITILGGGCATREIEPTEEYVKKEVEKRSGDLISTTEYLKKEWIKLDCDRWYTHTSSSCFRFDENGNLKCFEEVDKCWNLKKQIK